MNCHKVSNLLSAYIDGELTGVEMIEIRTHVGDCPDCGSDLDCIRATKRLVGTLHTVQPSADFAARICANLDTVQPYSFLAGWVRLWHYSVQKLNPALAMVTAAFVGLVIFGAHGFNDGLTGQMLMAQAPRTYLAEAVAFSPESPYATKAYGTAVLQPITSGETYGGGWISNASYVPGR